VDFSLIFRARIVALQLVNLGGLSLSVPFSSQFKEGRLLVNAHRS